MKSGISFFNRGVSRNLLKRFWPLWAAYLLILLSLPLSLSNQLASVHRDLTDTLDLAVIHNGVSLWMVSCAMGPLTAMAMFHYLYQPRSCGMMNALPLRRDTLFATAYLTGLLPLLLADLLVMGLTALLFCHGGELVFATLLDWLALAALSNIAFYGFAVFCAMLTGHLLILPLVYGLLTCAAAVAEAAVRQLLSNFVFGLSPWILHLVPLSPPVELYRSLHVSHVYQEAAEGFVIVPGQYDLQGLGLLAIYAAAGLLLSLAALQLYRRRRMETAGDVVAVPVLRPVFQYCLAFGCAVVLPCALDNMLIEGSLRGPGLAAVVLALMLISAFLGYWAAEMLMQKTMKVFTPRRWRGMLAVWAVLLVFAGVFEFDLTGYEKALPRAGDVTRVQLMGIDVELSEPENVQAVLDYHRELIAAKGEIENSRYGRQVELRYELSDGGIFSRIYRIPIGATVEEGTPLLEGAVALGNLPEAVMNRLTPAIPFVRENISDGTVSYCVPGEDGPIYQGLELTRDQIMDLYQNAILPDAEEGHIGHLWLVQDETYSRTVIGGTINLYLYDRSNAAGIMPGRQWDNLQVDVEADAERTLAWLKDNLGLEPMPFHDTDSALQFYLNTHGRG